MRLKRRNSIYHTAWYQLNHASVRKNVKRLHVTTWFGVCSYRKLKVTVEYKKRVCPICRHDLVEHYYFGDKRFVLDRSSPDYKRSCYEDLMENGRIVWFERVKPRWGSRSYE